MRARDGHEAAHMVPALQPLQIACHARRDVGVDDGRRRALILAIFRQDLRGERDVLQRGQLWFCGVSGVLSECLAQSASRTPEQFVAQWAAPD